MELFPLLLGATCVLAAVAVVGHGIWVGISWVVGGGAPGRKGQSCPRCGVKLERDQCGVCEWPVPPDAARRRPLAALGALEKQAADFERLGILEPAARRQFAQLIEGERARLVAAREALLAAKAAPGAAAEVLPVEPMAKASAPVAPPIIEPRPVAPPPHVASPAAEVSQGVDLPAQEVAAGATLVERARQFEAARAAAADQPRHSPAAPVAPLPPARSWLDVLAAFMEERNMRWGEMVGGLLIVCCSIALVVSFWSAIAERPWLKFFLFNGVTAGLFGVGFYSEHRWRLRTTSQGLQIIGSLLVPLNFLAIAAFSSAAAANSPLTLVGEVFSIGLFASLVFFAGRILVDHGPGWLVAGLLIPSIAQLLVRRFVEPSTGVTVLALLSALPLACYLAVNGEWIRRAAGVGVLSEEEINSLLKFFGLTSFAVVLPLALLLFKTGEPLETLRELPFVAGVLGLVPLGVGLTLWQKLAGRGLPALRTAGTSIAVLGAMICVSGLVLGWPEPRAMLPAALVEFAVFTFVAWWFAIPWAHLLAGACLAWAYLLGVNLFDVEIAWSGDGPLALARALVSDGSGTLLAPLVTLYGAAAFVAQSRRRPSALPLGCVAGALAAASVALVSWFGFGLEGDPAGAGWVYLVYAAGALTLAARSRRLAIPWIGAALLLAGVLQEVWFHYGEIWHLEHAEITAALVACSLAAAIAIVVRTTRAAVDDSPLEAVLWTATFFASLVAAAWLAITVPEQTAAFAAGHWFWLAVLWLLTGLAIEWAGVWTLFQVALSLAAVFAVVARLEVQPWFRESPRPWLDPWTLEAVGIALAGLNIAWAVVRIAVVRVRVDRPASALRAHVGRLCASPWLAVDRITSAWVVALLVAIASHAALPGVRQELSPAPVANLAANGTPTPTGRVVPPIEDFQWLDVPHDHGSGWGGWTLWAGVLVLVAVTTRERNSATWASCLLVVVAAVCPLLASRWEGDVAVASALRWLSTGFLVLGSAVVWWRVWARRRGAGGEWRPTDASVQFEASARALVIFLGLFPPLAILLAISAGALERAGQTALPWHELIPLAIVASIAALIAAALLRAPVGVLGGHQATRRSTWPAAASALVIVLVMAPLVATIVYQIGTALVRSPILGPNADSIFARMGLATSYAGPLVITALALVGYAIRERSGNWGLAAGLTLNLAATAAYLLAISHAGLRFDAAQWIRLAQLNTAVAAGYAIAWLPMLVRVRRRGDATESLAGDFALQTQLALAPALMGLALGWAWCDLVWDPEKLQRTSPMNAELADLWGWGSFALACTSVWAALWVAGRRVSMLGTSIFLVAVAIFAAVIVARWDSGAWESYHTLVIGHGAIGTVLLGLAWRERRTQGRIAESSSDSAPLGEAIAGGASAGWVVLQGAIVAGLALRELWDDYWWPIGELAFLGILLAPATAWVFQRRRYLYIAAVLINGAGLALADAYGRLRTLDEFVYWNTILLAAPTVPWLLIEVFAIRPRRFDLDSQVVPFHRLAARGALAILLLAVSVGLFDDATRWGWTTTSSALPWIALAAAGVAALACLWDVGSRSAMAGLYVWGLIACGMLLDVFDLEPRQLLWLGAAVAAAYGLATSYLWSLRDGLWPLAQRLGIPRGQQVELASALWLVPCNLLIAGAVVAMTLAVELTEHELPMRLLASQATLAQVISVALLARGDRRGTLQLIALVLGSVGAVMFAWSWLGVGTTLTMLHALVVLAATQAAVAVFYGFGLGKLLRDSSDWLEPARRLTPWLAAVSGVALVAILGVEVREFVGHRDVVMAWPAILVVALTLLGLSLAALAAAVLPGRDPLGLSERGRQVYVYGAEIVLALLFLHIRLTMPWLFGGLLSEYWPLVVMAIAFVGVGFGELCRRRKQEVLAEPIQNTGALLPVLPVLGFWAGGTRVDYSLLLLAVGVLYTGLSIARRSFGFGVLAALAANGGLWYFLSRQDGLGLLAHPQVWLIPPALCLLAAAYLNRQQLGEARMTAIRYFASMTIYLSSTGDIFMNGVAQAPYLPLVLAVLSVAGILAGMLLRVRAFLFLGTGFLVLSLFTIIWHAAVDLNQTWILWVSGIVLGLLILALFAMFEKKRQDVLEMVEKIKHWEG